MLRVHTDHGSLITDHKPRINIAQLREVTGARLRIQFAQHRVSQRRALQSHEPATWIVHVPKSNRPCGANLGACRNNLSIADFALLELGIDAGRVNLKQDGLKQVGAAKVGKADPLLSLEATMTVEWVGAMAPGARIVVYHIDPAAMSDPWSAFLLAVMSGLTGASLVFLFLVKVLLAQDQPLDAADYDMVGVLGHLSSAIRTGGTGEMSFSQAGVRRSAAARTEDGTAIEKGAEVIVTRYEKGIAYVRCWDDLDDSKERL